MKHYLPLFYSTKLIKHYLIYLIVTTTDHMIVIKMGWLQQYIKTLGETAVFIQSGTDFDE